MYRFRPSRPVRLSLVIGVVSFAVSIADAGGGGENAVVIVDPQVPESLYVGHYYATARDLPAENVLYMPAGAANFTSFLDFQRDALLGMLANRDIDDHVDFIVITPGTNYYVSAPNLVVDGCAAVTRFSASSVYVFSYIAETIGPNTPVTRRNHYFSTSSAIAFDSNVGWRLGKPSHSPDAERYFVGGMLGYSGERGNTIDEILDLIDRSVAVDGTRPEGTFYYVKTSDNARSGPRHGFYPSAVQALLDLGAQAEMLDCTQGGCNPRTVLPDGRHDILGVMTGWASPDIDGADMTILPGAMCDHLTSYAGHFGTGSQVKMSRWIANGANGSYGTVQEPCNYPGKFPHARFHVQYFEGLALGEAGLRSLSFLPWQVLAYGDPLTQPFAYLPQVRVPDAPSGEVSGVITLTPEGETEHPHGRIGGFDLIINGVTIQSVGRKGVFHLDTAAFPDGYNDMRVIGYDNTDVKAQNRWTGTLIANNRSRSAEVLVDPLTGDRATLFDIDVSAAGETVAEIRLVLNGRVLASTDSESDSFKIYGETIGAGPVSLQAQAVFDDGHLALSQPVYVDIAFDNPPEPLPDTEPPVAFGYTRVVSAGKPMLLELPGTDVDDPNLSYTVVDAPQQGEISGSGPLRLLKSGLRAMGADEMTFKVTSQGVESNLATIHLFYEMSIPCDDIKKFKARCKRGKIKGNVVLTNTSHHEETVTVSVDGAPFDVPIDEKKAKFKFPDQQPGQHTVALEFPPNCVEPKSVRCE